MNGGAVLLLLAGLGFSVWALRRKGATAPRSPEVALLERRPLGRDAGVALLEVRGRSLVVGFGAGGVRLLADLGAAPERRP